MTDAKDQSFKNFQLFLLSIDGGRFHSQLTNDLEEIVAQLKAHKEQYGGSPSATLNLQLKLSQNGDIVDVVPTRKVTMPAPVFNRSSYYATDKNRLSRQNPNQVDMFAPQEVKENA